MKNQIQTAKRIKAALEPMTMRELQALADASGVPFRTIYKIRIGTTMNPGIDTVAKFLPFMPRHEAA